MTANATRKTPYRRCGACHKNRYPSYFSKQSDICIECTRNGAQTAHAQLLNGLIQSRWTINRRRSHA